MKLEWLSFLVSLVPFVELRGAFFMAAVFYPLEVALVGCVVLNILVVPIAFLIIDFILPRLASRYKTIDGFFRWARRRAENHGNLTFSMLLLFVAVPIPGSGAYTGSLIACVTGMKRSRAFIAISLGVLFAGLILYSIVKMTYAS
ncbi:MAG: small multi-drug export protein [Candidatus Hadarchaeales archaeon]